MYYIIVNQALQPYTTQLVGADPTVVHPPPVVSIWMSSDNKYGFIELFSANLASVAMSLNGLQCGGATLRIARPKTYSEQYNGVSNITGATGAATAMMMMGAGAGSAGTSNNYSM